MIHWFTADVQILKIDLCKKVMTILSPEIQPIYKNTLGPSKFRLNKKPEKHIITDNLSAILAE